MNKEFLHMQKLAGLITENELLTPKDVIRKYGWLFLEDSGRIPQGVVIKMMEEYETLRTAQLEAEKAQLVDALVVANEHVDSKLYPVTVSRNIDLIQKHAKK